MEADCENAFKYGFVIAEVHGKSESLLKESDYNGLQQASGLDEILVKLSNSPYSKFVNEGMELSKKEFNTRLNQALVADYRQMRRNSDGDMKILMDYFVQFYQLQNFIYLLDCKVEDPSLSHAITRVEMLGWFQELDTLKFVTDMQDVYRFCVEGTFLKPYYDKLTFDNEISKNNWSLLQSQFTKLLMEDFAEKLKDCKGMSFMNDILRREGDRRILEIVINSINSNDITGKARRSLFPRINSFGLSVLDRLAECTSMDEMRAAISTHNLYRKLIVADDSEMLNVLFEMEMANYMYSFIFHNDISCVYSYLKVKEQEVKNILWIIECISQDRRDLSKNISIPSKFMNKN
ncbi:V-type proton ATPase subunit d [Astathelohania contejeani]|uniref:V-type proton ATPase subunit d n=1 Tax=Astathelohania contejeani TaxID=164912 RepID=A0ABQ7I2B1_9MICR|nr:V-type proton ATPase subunit d [Thelohania contejeani]